MLGSVTGPAIGTLLFFSLLYKNVLIIFLGPCIGGVIVTFASWRYIYWLQTAMAGVGLILSLIFVPEVQQEAGSGIEEKEKKITPGYVLKVFNPVRVFRLWLYPNVFLSVREPPTYLSNTQKSRVPVVNT